MKNVFVALLLGLTAGGARPVMAQAAPPAPSPAPAGLPVVSRAECPSYSGRVLTNSKPLAGVSVTVRNSRILVITNEDGFFTFPAGGLELPALDFRAAGYAPQEASFVTCGPLFVEMQLLPGTRIKKRGRKKGFIMRQGY